MSRAKKPDLRPLDRAVFILILRLCDPLRLESMHGSRITDAVYHDLTRRFEGIARAVLVNHMFLEPPWSPELGLWLVPFRMSPLDPGADAAEQADSIRRAATEMVREMLDAEIGRAASMHVDFRVGVLRDDSGAAEPARLFERLSDAIAKLDHGDDEPLVSRETFGEILKGPCIDFHFQPIVSLEGLSTVGFEALARGPSGGPVERADRLFAAASFYGLRRELDLACVSSALGKGSHLPAPFWLSVNLGPDIFEAELLRKLTPDSTTLRRRVFEITEHIPIASPEKFAAQAKPLRRRGARVALDDAGCGFLNMSMVADLSPHIVKLCITIIRRIEGGPMILGAIRNTVRRIREAGAIALAEGVETEEQMRLVRDCGFELAQGWFFGRPKPARDVIHRLKS